MTYQISPTRRFVEEVAKKRGVDLGFLVTEYTLPKGWDPQTLEHWLVEKVASNVGAQVQPHTVKALFGHNRYIVDNFPPPEEGEATIEYTRQLRELTRELIALNPTLADIKPDAMNGNQLFNVVWGALCQINETDLKSFAVDIQQSYYRRPRHMSDQQKLAFQQKAGLAGEVEVLCGARWEWVTTPATLAKVKEAFVHGSPAQRLPD